MNIVLEEWFFEQVGETNFVFYNERSVASPLLKKIRLGVSRTLYTSHSQAYWG